MSESPEETQTTQDGDDPARSAGNVWRERLKGVLGRALEPIRDSFLPQPHYLEGEEVDRVIRMAPYRARIPTTFALVCSALLFLSLAGYLVTRMTVSPSDQLIAAGLGLVALVLLLRAAEARLEYEQWQFIITNKRFIIVTPDPQRQAFADAIYLKQGSIRVLDTNFSKNPIWGFFQITRGTRDVMLSLTPYEFQESGAQVKGGLRFPDVREEDIHALEELIFGE